MADQSIELDHRTDAEGRLCVEVRGELDAHGAAALRAWFDQLPAGGARDVRLDLSAVPFLDSTGLAALVDLKRTVTTDGGSLVLDGWSRQIERVLHIAGLAEHFQTP